MLLQNSLCRSTTRLFQLLVATAIFFIVIPVADAAVLRPLPNNLGLAAYWSLNDATGTKATDFSGNGNTGTLGGNASWVTGKKARALSFDGNGDYVDLGSSSTIRPTSLLSVSMWVKIAGDGAGSSPNMFISTQVGGSGWRVGYETSDDKIYFDLWDNGGNNTEARTTAAVSTGVWYHILAVYNGTATVALYLNGVSQTWVGGSNNGTIGDPAANPALGGYANSPGTYSFNGQLDDVRIYNRALSAADALLFYNAGLAVIKARNNNGLVGYWSFEDGVGTKATDFSGNGNTGTLAGTLTWVAGKRGKAVEFNGNNEIVLPNNSQTNFAPSGQMTVSAWFKKTDVGQNNGIIYSNYNSVTNANFQLIVRDAAGDLLMQHNDNTATLRLNAGVAGSFKNKWYHVAFTNNNGFASLYLDGAVVATSTYTVAATTFDYTNIGRSAGGAYPFTGPIDDVRVYNRELSATEVANLYAEGSTANPTIKTVSRNGLVGYWSLDDGAGTKATDFSGNNRTADLTNMEAGDWVAGKRGKALSFDGVNEAVNYAGVVASTPPVTVSAWFYPTSSDQQRIYGLAESSGGHNLSSVLINYPSAGNVTGQHWDGSNNALPTATANFTLNTWNHVVFVVASASSRTIYLNGGNAASDNSTTGAVTPDNFTIGLNTPAAGSQYFSGLIDDVRVYNRALSLPEIQTLYTIGK